MPFDFMVQVAFTSAAINLLDKEQEKYVDRQPLEFDRILEKIEALVNRGIDDQGLRPQFEDLRKFAVLQRLFRAALKGNFGDRFPTLKLAQLAKDTAGAAPYFHTKRWNNTSLVASLEADVRRAQSFREGIQPWMNQAAARLPACDAALRRTLATASDSGAAEACQFSEFSAAAQKACPDGADRNSAGCAWGEIVYASGALAGIQRDEIAFGVLDDERQTPDAACPP